MFICFVCKNNSNDGSKSGNCTVVNNLVDGGWSIDSCSTSYYFACQTTPGECPTGWTPFKNKCYLMNGNRQKYTSWFDAKSTCSKYGAQLLTINE